MYTQTTGSAARLLGPTVMLCCLGCSPPRPAPSPQAASASAGPARPKLRTLDEGRRPINEKYSRLFFSGDFEELERVAKELRSSGKHEYGARSAYDVFLIAVAPDYRKLEEGDLERRTEKIKQWLERHPKSEAAHLALARAYGQAAWSARGHEYFSEVAEDGRKEFRKLSELEFDLLRKADQLPEPSANVSAAMLILGRSLGMPKPMLLEIYEEGLRRDPKLDVLHLALAATKLERWGGKVGDVRKFAIEVAAANPGQWGSILFARIPTVIGLSYPHALRYEEFDWEQLRAGIQAWLETSPDSSYITNYLAWAACAFGDAATAAPLFEWLEYGTDKDAVKIWGTKPDGFTQCQSWARSDSKALVQVELPAKFKRCVSEEVMAAVAEAVNYCAHTYTNKPIDPVASVQELSVAIGQDPRPGEIMYICRPTEVAGSFDLCMIRQLKPLRPKVLKAGWACPMTVKLSPPLRVGIKVKRRQTNEQQEKHGL